MNVFGTKSLLLNSSNTLTKVYKLSYFNREATSRGQDLAFPLRGRGNLHRFSTQDRLLITAYLLLQEIVQPPRARSEGNQTPEYCLCMQWALVRDDELVKEQTAPGGFHSLQSIHPGPAG